MPTTLTNGIQLPDKGSVDWYSSMQSNYNLIDTHLGDTDVHVTAEDKANWDSKQGSLSQAQLDAIAQVAINTDDIATLQSGKANASHTHSSSDITDIDDYATKDYVDNSISGLVDNAPDALNTLNELSAALNDDSNFASTVATALSAKANSADLATVATSGSYTDLTDKPTIPTNTSDLTNDSNFVDTSNPAVSSGITSAKVTDYDTHVADTDIHVTTADKNKWNNGVTQSYVFRYSSTALVASSTNSNTLLDNTDNLKVGDKVIDSDGVIYSVTAIDTANSTFTIGTSLIDLAQDSDVVHKSVTETVDGFKQFANIRVTNSIKGINLDSTTTDLNNCYSDFSSYGESKGGNIQYYYCNTDAGTANISNLPESKAFFLTSITTRLISNSLYVKQILINSNNKTFTRYCNNSTWSSWVNETDSEYVHKSGDETIGGNKTYNDLQIINYGTQYKGARNAYILPEFSASYSGLSITTLGYTQTLKIGNFVLDANNKPSLDTSKGYIQIATGEKNGVNACAIEPKNSTSSSSLGTSVNKWSKIYGTEYYYGSNNVEFSTKFVTTDTAQTVSGQKIFNDINMISSSSEIGVSGGNTSFKVLDKNNKILARLQGGTFSTGMAYSYWLVNNGTDAFNGISLYQASANLVQLRPFDSTLNAQLGASNRYFTNCYTSKVNNLEPSSLSLPSGNANDVIDISSYISALDGTSNSYTVPANGWVSIAVVGTAIAIVSSSWSDSRYRTGSGNVRMLYPVLKNETLGILVTGTTLAYARFIPCQGNV